MTELLLFAGKDSSSPFPLFQKYGHDPFSHWAARVAAAKMAA